MLADNQGHLADGREHRARGAALRTAAGDVPVLLAIHAEPAGGLTRREQEVALLAADGATAPEIADRLYISARTVHTHLQRAYRKLGVHDRDGLAERLRGS